LQYLKKKSREHTKFSWTGLAMGCLIEEGLKGGLLGFDLRWSSALVYESGRESLACSTLRGVGETVREILMKGEEARNRYRYEAGIVTCQNKILAALERSSGKEWSIGVAEVKEAVREGNMRMDKGFLDGAMVLLERSVWFGRLDDVGIWQKAKADVNGQKHAGNVVGKAVEQVLMELEKNGEMDCGCG